MKDTVGIIIKSSLEQTFGDANVKKIGENYICEIPGHYTARLNYFETPKYDFNIRLWCIDAGIDIDVFDNETFRKDNRVFTSTLNLGNKENPTSYVLATLGKRIQEHLPF